MEAAIFNTEKSQDLISLINITHILDSISLILCNKAI